jgi:glycosyltransferase involved in cell wall biosynthesis
MRIAISTPAYPLPGDPTRGRYIYEIARCLGNLATVEVFFHTGRYPRHRWLQPRTYVLTDITTDLSTEDVHVTSFDYPSLPLVSRMVNGYVSGRALLGHLRDFAPDVILGYWLYPEGFGAWRCSRSLGVPCVLGGLGTDIRARDGLTRWFTGRALRGASRSIMVSEEMRRLAIDRFQVPAERVHTIHNGVNTAVFHPRSQAALRSRLGLPDGARVIIYVGRFVATKGLRELLDAFTALAARRDDVHLVLVGDGVMRPELDTRVSAAPCRARIHMPGALQPSQVAEWIGAADLLCLPSYSEGHPNVVVEALACGRPVVATDVGGTPEIINGDNGIMVPPRDSAALEAALAAVLDGSWNHAAIAAAWSRGWDEVAAATLEVCELARGERARQSRDMSNA